MKRDAARNNAEWSLLPQGEGQDEGSAKQYCCLSSHAKCDGAFHRQLTQ
jgi:hypothetical protein